MNKNDVIKKLATVVEVGCVLYLGVTNLYYIKKRYDAETELDNTKLNLALVKFDNGLKDIIIKHRDDEIAKLKAKYEPETEES